MDNEFVYAQLSACLALVRPVGMTENETMDWLAVAADCLSDLPDDILETGCRIARRKCTHHSQIVPTVIGETEELMRWRKMSANTPLRLVPAISAPAIEQPAEPLPDPDTLMPSLRRMGLARGWITNSGGKLVWSEDAA